MPRFFHVLEAERLLPEVEPLLRDIIDCKRQFEHSARELNLQLEKIAAAGGMIPPRERIAELREQKETAAQRLRAALEKLEETGCLLKDADIGLIDFPTRYQGREVYLCWKLGESGIRFWHHIEDGFRGRKPIDSEFLSSHQGDR
ncbi:MAG TPA: DUF2203 domain-containing protein [Bryobacteraceae bacterium]|jgi:hypothetical protein|nr:DUF2203 domain-containing protein [Bryobacteraceae bacterium]